MRRATARIQQITKPEDSYLSGVMEDAVKEFENVYSNQLKHLEKEQKDSHDLLRNIHLYLNNPNPEDETKIRKQMREFASNHIITGISQKFMPKPYTEPGWQIIETKDHRKFLPKLTTDEVLNKYDGTWGRPMDDGIFWPDAIYRRRIQPETKAVEQGWVSVKEVDRLPLSYDPIYVGNNSEVRLFENGFGCSGLENGGWTHWMRYVKPAAPTPPKSAAELAFQEQFKKVNTLSGGLKDHFKETWFAAIEWQINQGKKS